MNPLNMGENVTEVAMSGQDRLQINTFRGYVLSVSSTGHSILIHSTSNYYRYLISLPHNHSLNEQHTAI